MFFYAVLLKSVIYTPKMIVVFVVNVS